MRSFLLTVILLSSASLIGQEDYSGLVEKAWSQYQSDEYLESGKTYEQAFKANGNKGLVTDRYNAACSWALAGESDKAFDQLFKIAGKGNYTNLPHMLSDSDLNSLHEDKRWDKLVSMVKENKEKKEANYNKELVAILDSVYQEDQKYRQQAMEMSKEYDWNAPEMQGILQTMHERDSANLILVTQILDEYGWLGPDEIGDLGNSTLFLVIQHADLETQLKYLPMMRQAVKDGDARGSSLALLEDRTNLRQGKKQVYGSQIATDPETGEKYVQPLEDPDKVDERRAAVGLEPLGSYTKRFDFDWDVEAYKKRLPYYESIQQTY